LSYPDVILLLSLPVSLLLVISPARAAQYHVNRMHQGCRPADTCHLLTLLCILRDSLQSFEHFLDEH